MRKSRQKSGFSLVELAIGLAVITVLILSVSLSSGIRENAKVQSASQSITALRLAAENYIATGKMNYAGLTVATLKTENLLPSSFTGTTANPWGGNYTIVPNTANNTKVDIAVTAVPASESTKLISLFANSSSATAYDTGTKTWTATF